MVRISIHPVQIAPLDVWEQYDSTRTLLFQTAESVKKAMLSGAEVQAARFSGMSTQEVDAWFEGMLEEADAQASLFLIAAAEAALRVDSLRRVYEKKQDEISKAFRKVYKKKRDHRKVRLDEDILETWVQKVPQSKMHVGNLRGAFNYRHWLAHGRYWVPKLGMKYDAAGVFKIVENLFGEIGLPLN